MSIPKVVFSTTLGWNPGDEIILQGIQNLFQGLRFDYQPLVFDRNPNSYDETQARLNLKADQPDIVVFAGSPEWWQEKAEIGSHFARPLSVRRLLHTIWPSRADRANDPLLDEILLFNLRCGVIGGGSSRRPYPGRKLKEVLARNTDVFAVRDRQTAEVFAPFKPTLLPCPALFSATAQQRRELTRIGITLQRSSSTLIRMSSSEQKTIDTQVDSVLSKYKNTDLLAHTRSDADFLRATYPNVKVRVADSGEALVSLYRDYDFIMSTRLHGCVLACALGIPTFQLHHGLRMAALDQLPVFRRSADGEPIDVLSRLRVEDKSRELGAFQVSMRREYETVLAPVLKKWQSLGTKG